MNHHCSSSRRFSCPLLVSAAVVGVSQPSAALAQTYTFDATEAAFDASYAATPIALSGTVATDDGSPLANATIRVIAWGAGAANAGRTTTTNAAGQFTLTGLARRSVLIAVERQGHYTEIVPVDLHRPTNESTASAGLLVVKSVVPGRARVIFGGDSMFGRRFVDADEDGVEGEPGDLIRPASRAADAQALLTYVRAPLSAADYTFVNLESPVTSDPETPHPYKSFTFFSYPETLAGLTWAGIDGVNLANNHVFDFLGQGVADTLSNVASAGLDACGAGLDESSALGTTIRRAPNGVPLSLLGFDERISDGSTDPDYLLVARDPDKAGALEASADNVGAFLDDEAADRFAIPMFHGGAEYSSYPTNAMRRLFVSSVEGGAGLVVAHHPHTTHGIGLVDASGEPRFVLLSLGNFLFDQDIFATFRSYLAVADVEAMPGGGRAVSRLELIPFHLEGYVPQLLAGAALASAARDIGHLSTTLPLTPSGSNTADGLRGATVFPVGHRAVALRDTSQYATSSTTQTITASVSASHSTVSRELIRTSDADSLSSIRTSATATAEYGRDILKYGNFEDDDVDGDFSEGTAWDQTSARYVQNSVVRSGTGALVLLRKSTNVSDTSAGSLNRIPFPGGSKLTFRGYVRGNNAGTFRVTTRYYDKDGDTLSTTDRYTKSAGTYGWTAFDVTVTAPSSAASLRIWFKQSPPSSGEGRAFVDDCAIVLWESPKTGAASGISLPTPNNWSYYRFFNVSSSVSSLTVTLGHRTYAAL